MTVYRLNIDLLEAAKDEYISSAEKLGADIDTSYTTISNTNENIYAGIDAFTFRSDFTRYVDGNFTKAWETVSHMGTALDNGLDDARGCKKLCNDFAIALGGGGNGKAKEDMKGELYCDQSVIGQLKVYCVAAMEYAEAIRLKTVGIDRTLAELQMVHLNSAAYTNVIREGCNKVNKLEEHSGELTAYASAVECADDGFKSALDSCVPFFYFLAGTVTDHDISFQAEMLIEIMNASGDQMTKVERKLVDEYLGELLEGKDIAGLQKVAESIGNGKDGGWTVCDAHVAARILNYGEVNCNVNLAGTVYNKMKKVELIEKKTDVHTNYSRNTFVYEMSFDQEKVASILGELDPEEEGLTYYSLQRRSKYVERVEKSDWDAYAEEPGADFGITFKNAGGKLVSIFDADGSKTELASVDMNEIIGEEGKANLRNLGFSKEESIALMSSIYTDEDISFIGDLTKANTQDDYCKLFRQYDPDDLGNAVTEALYQYSYGLLSQNVTYNADWYIVKQDLSQLENFVNGLMETDIYAASGVKDYLAGLAVQSNLQMDSIAAVIAENFGNKDNLKILVPNYEVNAKLYDLYAALYYMREEDSRMQNIGCCLQLSDLKLGIIRSNKTGIKSARLMETNFYFDENIMYYDEGRVLQTSSPEEGYGILVTVHSGNNSLGIKKSYEVFEAEKERKMAVPKTLLKAGISTASVFQPWVGVAAGAVEAGMTLEESVMQATAKDTFSILNDQYLNGSRAGKVGITVADGLLDTILSYREADRKVKELQGDIETSLFGEVIVINGNSIVGEGTYSANSLLKKLELETNGLSFMADPTMKASVIKELKEENSSIVSKQLNVLRKKTSLKKDEIIPALYLIWTGEAYEDSEIDSINKLKANDIKLCMEALNIISYGIAEGNEEVAYTEVSSEAYMGYSFFN